MTVRLRNSAKAIIVRDGRLLVQRNESSRDPEGHWLLLPGGGQQPGETLVEAVRREVLEEAGFVVEPGPLLWIREYIGSNHEFAHFNPEEHQIEFMFAAQIVGGDGVPTQEDAWQVSVAWLAPSEIRRARLFPKAMRESFAAYVEGGAVGSVYRGDVN